MSDPARVPIPRRLPSRPRDPRGFAISWFSLILPDGSARISVNDSAKRSRALAHRLCWTCGQPLGRFVSFVLGPVQTLSRITTELPSHRECILLCAARLPISGQSATRAFGRAVLELLCGYRSPLPDNPGLHALWVTRTYQPEPTPRDARIIRIGEPESVTWRRGGSTGE
jgi:hypothetical protein